VSDDLKVGDEVVSKADGPTMTVTSVDFASVTTTWFGKGKAVQYSGSFPLDAVRRLRPRGSPPKVNLRWRPPAPTTSPPRPALRRDRDATPAMSRSSITWA
jgi:uncharacterized protein YodC (DUF2158 family)